MHDPDDGWLTDDDTTEEYPVSSVPLVEALLATAGLLVAAEAALRTGWGLDTADVADLEEEAHHLREDIQGLVQQLAGGAYVADPTARAEPIAELVATVELMVSVLVRLSAGRGLTASAIFKLAADHVELEEAIRRLAAELAADARSDTETGIDTDSETDADIFHAAVA